MPISFLSLRGLLKSFSYHNMRKRREFLAFRHHLVCHQEMCSEIVGCRSSHHPCPGEEHRGQQQSPAAPTETQHPAGTGSMVLLVPGQLGPEPRRLLSLSPLSVSSVHQSNQGHNKKSLHGTPVLGRYAIGLQIGLGCYQTNTDLLST